MSDPLTQLEHLELPPVPQPEAVVVRRRGDAIRRRRHASVAAVGAAAAVAVIAFVLTPATKPDHAQVPQPAVTDTAPASPTPTESETPHTTPPPTLPYDLDLAVGYPRSDGDGTLHKTSTKPGVDTLELCKGQVAFDPHSATAEDVMGASYSGPEDSRARTLVTYPDAHAAADAFHASEVAEQACEARTKGWDIAIDTIPYTAGQDSNGIRVRYRNESGGFDTGLTLYHVVRYRQLLLVTMEYGEGNGSPQTRDLVTMQFERADQPVVDALPGLLP